MFVIQSFNQFYININDGGDTFIETYSLREATKFKTKKTAEKWVSEYTDWKDYTNVIRLTDDMLKEYDEWAKRMIRRQMPKLDKSGTWDYNPKTHTPMDVLEFHINLHENEHKVPYDSYTTWPEVYECFEYIHGVNVHTPSNIGDASSVTYKFSFHPKRSNYDDFKKEFDLVLSLDPTLKDRDGNNIFHIFDHYLCEHGNMVHLVMVDYDNDKFAITGSSSFSGTLRECFDFLVKYRYYSTD